MKKILSIVLATLCLSFIACANEQIISFEQLPQTAQELIKTHFPQEQVSYVMQERDGFSMEYEVRFASGQKVEFDKVGSLKKADCGTQAVPEALIPEAVRAYVAAKFPNAIITEWSKDDRRWKAELNNGLELEFNSKYEFVRIDD